jgi:hypothetical protein
MQRVSDAFLAELLLGKREPRRLAELIELYPADYALPVTGFEPKDAIARYAKTRITWNGYPYQKQVTSRGDIQRSAGTSFNNVTVTFSNVTRSMAAFVINNEVEGMYMVIRLVARRVVDSSVTLFSGKCEKPDGFDEDIGTIEAKQLLASIDLESQKYLFHPNAPPGRTPDDPLFEGIRFLPLAGTFDKPVTTASTSFFGRLFNKKKTTISHEQWSSADDTPYGEVQTEAFGRVQIQGIPLQHADIGGADKGLWFYCRGRIHDFTFIKNQTQGLGQPDNITKHLGDPGGTGTNALPDQQFPNAGLYSNLAYIGAGIPGGDVDTVDSAPTITSVVLARLVKIPDADGNFTIWGWSDNPAYIARFYLTSPDFCGLPEELIDDAECIKTARHCDGLIADLSNTDRILIPQEHIAGAGSLFHRLRSSGVIHTGFYALLLGYVDFITQAQDGPYEPFDPEDPPVMLEITPQVRRRYTCNFTMTEKNKAVDTLNDVISMCAKLYFPTGANGKIQIKTDKPADSVLLKEDLPVAALEIPVEDIEPYRANPYDELLIGVLPGSGLVTSETRKIVGTKYSAAGNAIALLGAATGALTATASSATLTGGTDSVAPSATVTIGGAAAGGSQISATIDGHLVAYTLNTADTVETAAGMLSAFINADPTLKRYIEATWDVDSPTVVTLKSKLGALKLDRPLHNAHAAGEEVIRVAMVFDKSNIFKKSFKWPLAGDQSSYNGFEMTFFDSANDYSKQPITVNDEIRQARTRKPSIKKIDGSAIDNRHQAERILNWQAAKYGDGDKLFEWASTGRALLLEEGDVVPLSDDTGGFVNAPASVEELVISENWTVTARGRIYSTEMHSDEAAQRIVPLPSVFRSTWPTQNLPTLDNIDDAVPVVTLPPIVTRTNDVPFKWKIFIPKPTAKAYSIYDNEVRLRAASDPDETILLRSAGGMTEYTVDAFDFDCLVDVRWRNGFRTGDEVDATEGGWSAFSPTATAYGLSSTPVAPNPVENTVSVTVADLDPGDVGNFQHRETLYLL